LLRRLKDATTQAGESQRRAHQFDERAALDRVMPLLRLLRKLARDKLTKLRRISQFFKTAPVFLPATRRLSILQSKDVIAHQLEIYVTVAIAHLVNGGKWNNFPGCVFPGCGT